MGEWKIGDSVVYRGKTYSFPGEVCGLTDDDQVIVRATVPPYAGMKHIYGPAQLSASPAPSLPEGVERVVERLRNGTMDFAWADLPDDAEIPAVPLLRDALALIQSLSSQLAEVRAEVERLDKVVIAGMLEEARKQAHEAANLEADRDRLAAENERLRAPVGGPVPTDECEFRIGQPVRLAEPYAGDDPNLVYFVTGIRWEHRPVPARGWDITIATAEELAKGHGQTDGFAPSDLRAALASLEERG